ncbi:MAG: UPF0104 family protein [Desulfobacteraceae bacterium]|nr:MAG: UPF0104 family protein [Desulfobacteraceae bacterium]
MQPLDQTRRPLRKDGKKRALWKFVGYAVGAACLIWVFHDVNPSRLLKSIADMKWQWVALAIFCDILGYCGQGVQWSLLLHPLGRVPLLRSIQAIYAGLFVNEMLPMRAGELVRVLLVSRWISVDFLSVVPSVLVGRLFDGIWLFISIGVTAAFVSLPKKLMEGMEALGFAVFAGLFLLFWVIRPKKEVLANHVHNDKRRRMPQLFRSRIQAALLGIRAIGTTSHFYISFAVSVLYLLFEGMAFWIGTLAYGISLSFWPGVASFLIVRLGTSVPSTPSNVGTYQFFTVFALSLFGVDKTDAAGFSAVIFVMLTAPLWLIGLFAISRTGMKFQDVRQGLANLIEKGP